MPFHWDSKRIDWFLDASAYTGYHRELAQRLSPHLHREDRLVDLACGLGCLSLEISDAVRSIEAVDIHPPVIDSLIARANERGIDNLHAHVASFEAVTTPCDVALVSFFGKDAVLHSLSIARRLIIWLMNANSEGHLYPQKYRRPKEVTIASSIEVLHAHHLRYTLLEDTIEFGQPFRTRDDAIAFLRDHAPEADDRELDAFLERFAQPACREDYALYLPNPKRIGIFFIDPASSAEKGPPPSGSPPDFRG